MDFKLYGWFQKFKNMKRGGGISPLSLIALNGKQTVINVWQAASWDFKLGGRWVEEVGGTCQERMKEMKGERKEEWEMEKKQREVECERKRASLLSDKAACILGFSALKQFFHVSLFPLHSYLSVTPIQCTSSPQRSRSYPPHLDSLSFSLSFNFFHLL